MRSFSIPTVSPAMLFFWASWGSRQTQFARSFSLVARHQRRPLTIGTSSSLFQSTAASSSTTNQTTITSLVNGRDTVEKAVLAAFGSLPPLDDDTLQPITQRADTAVTLATQASFGDFQCNAALRYGKKSRQVGQHLVDSLALSTIWEHPPTLAGPGFLNLRYSHTYLSQAIALMASDDNDRVGIPPTDSPQTIVVDYSSPNIAKDMHVGHLRSTVIGDCISTLLEWRGHTVIRLNHVGDWGTQFGMLVEQLQSVYPHVLADNTNTTTTSIGDLVVMYKQAKERFDTDDDFRERARRGVVELQAGNATYVRAWKLLCAASRQEFQTIYDILEIRGLQERGESFYNSYLQGIVQDLQEQGLAVESNGATAVFLEGYQNRDGTPQPMLIQKTDGGYNYATTDLAAIRHRVETEKADRVLYVTDAGQAQHFDMVFCAAKKANYVPDQVSLEHVPFGLVQGEDGKKFATRSGDTVKLKDLLTEAVARAAADMQERGALSDPSVATTVGIAAVKYADLSMNRESNYRFSYERMLSLNGNTAPYMLYAYARICGIIRKATGQTDNKPVEWPTAATTNVILGHETEIELARNLVKLPDILAAVEKDLYPNRICDYLFETSQKFNQFYESCSVNNAETEEVKASRLSLCTATARTLRLLLRLLGITTVEKL